MTGVYPVMSNGLFCSDGFSPACLYGLIYHTVEKSHLFIRCVYPNDRCLSSFVGRIVLLRWLFSTVCTAIVHHPLCRKSIMITPPLVQPDDYYLTLFAPDESLWHRDRKVHLFDLNHLLSSTYIHIYTSQHQQQLKVAQTMYVHRILSKRRTAHRNTHWTCLQKPRKKTFKNID